MKRRKKIRIIFLRNSRKGPPESFLEVFNYFSNHSDVIDIRILSTLVTLKKKQMLQCTQNFNENASRFNKGKILWVFALWLCQINWIGKLVFKNKQKFNVIEGLPELFYRREMKGSWSKWLQFFCNFLRMIFSSSSLMNTRLLVH